MLDIWAKMHFDLPSSASRGSARLALAVARRSSRSGGCAPIAAALGLNESIAGGLLGKALENFLFVCHEHSLDTSMLESPHCSWHCLTS
jgi:hypothetical protein